MFDTCQRLLFLEFRSLDGGEFHGAAFSRLLKPNPYAAFAVAGSANDREVIMLGTDQRDYFVPLLREGARRLADDDAVFDIGCGDGQTTKSSFEDIQSRPVTNILDPSAAYIAQYENLLDAGVMPLKKGRRFVERIDSLMDRSEEDNTVRSLFNSHALCLAIHCLYFFADGARFLKFDLDCVRPGGRAIAVFADETGGYSGILARSYYDVYDPAPGVIRRQKIERRFRLFGIGEESMTARRSTTALQDGLGRSDFRVLASLRHGTRMYGNGLGDIFALAFIAGLSDIDYRPLALKIDFVGEALFRQPERFGLAVELDGPRATMLSVLQPQYYFCLERVDGGD